MNRKRGWLLMFLVLIVSSLMSWEIVGVAPGGGAEATTTPGEYSISAQGKQIDEVWLSIGSILGIDKARERKIWDPTGWEWLSFDEVYEIKGAAGITDASQWTFQSNVKNQWGDASPELLALLACIRGRIPDRNIAVISSISDSAGLALCKDRYTKPPCHHVENSAHYGCSGQSQKSLAVDFGDETSTCVIVAAAKACGVDKGHIFGSTSPLFVAACGGSYTPDPMENHEGHIHISVQTVRCG